MTNYTYDDLNDQQKAAVDAVFDAIQKKKHLTIQGFAGSGKSFTTRFIIEALIKKGTRGIILAAPTHQAKKVLSKMAGMEASTIHAVLKINPNNYEDTQVFEQKDTPDLAECDVLICDEASMYDEKLFNILIQSVPRNCTVIAIGDPAQIRPVDNGNNGKISLFFESPLFEQVQLTKVVRSNGPIIQVSTDIRNGAWIYNHVQDGAGVHDLTGTKESLKTFFQKYFSIVKTPEDLFETRMLAYTNKSVDNLNKIIRKKIYETTDDFINNEVVVMQEPLIKSVQYEGKTFSEVIFNNGEYVKVIDCRSTADMVGLKNIPASYMVQYWELDLVSLDSGEKGSIKVITDEKEYNKLALVLGTAAEAYKSGKVPANWKSFWRLKNSFHKVKPLPVSTIHKSQGTTVDTTFLYTPCLHKADGQLAKQLLYVGATRARHNVYFI